MKNFDIYEAIKKVWCELNWIERIVAIMIVMSGVLITSIAITDAAGLPIYFIQNIFNSISIFHSIFSGY